MPEKNLEGKLLRDRIGEIGLLAGSAIGLIYALTTQDNEGASFVQRVLLDGWGQGGITGAGVGYCIGTIAKPIYEAVKKYRVVERG